MFFYYDYFLLLLPKKKPRSCFSVIVFWEIRIEGFFKFQNLSKNLELFQLLTKSSNNPTLKCTLLGNYQK
jgi:hypothetical protein